MTRTENETKTTHRGLVTIGLLCSVFLSAMEGTAISTAMPTIIGDLGGVELYAWVFAAYMFASSITVPLFGKLGDQFGRKPIYIGGLVVFVTGSLLCGVAQNIYQLILFRLIQGLGAGAVQPMALTIIGDLYALRERAKIQAAFGTLWGIAGIIGPLLGSFFVEVADWRWIFYINLPFGLAAVVIVASNLHEQVKHVPHVIDWLGFALMTFAATALMLSVEGIAPVRSIPACVLLIAAFIAVELRAKEPLLAYSLFRQRLMWVTCLLGISLGIQMFGVLSYLPLYCQGVLHATPSAAGGVITALVFGWPLSSYPTGKLISRYGFRPFVVSGCLLVALSCGAIAFAVENRWQINAFYLSTFCLGCGFGLMNTALILAVQTSVDWSQRGVATASTMFFRTMGGTIAVALLGAVLKQSLLSDASVPLDYTNALLRHDPALMADTAKLRMIADILWQGLSRVFWLCFTASLVGVLLSLVFPPAREQAN